MTRSIRTRSSLLAVPVSLLPIAGRAWMDGREALAAPAREVPRPDLPTEGPAADVAREMQAMFDAIAEIGADPDDV